MINGLQLTIPGEEVRRLLEKRIEDHRQRADWWKREQARTPEEQTEDEPLMPEHICENEAQRHEWRAAVLGFIRDRIEPAEVYRLGEADLAFGELLPEKPGSLEQEEYEERTRVGFHLERLTRSAGELRARELAAELTPLGLVRQVSSYHCETLAGLGPSEPSHWSDVLTSLTTVRTTRIALWCDRDSFAVAPW